MGASSLLQGLSGIGKDGVSTINVVGLRRAGFGPALRKEVKDAFALLYRSGLNSTQALEEAKRRSWSKEVPGQKNLDPGSVAHVTNRRR
jgi:acyl-[acyl carrier protein]--UDP-N-acetylglucosamine O-acyltransferase